MKLPLPCLQCAKPVEGGPPGAITTVFVFVELEGEHLFRVTCPAGHSSVVGLNQPRFEILYESGALALLDGYYREAVATFAAAVERFQEYWIRATLLQAGVPADALAATWKLVDRSERQSGAYFLLYLREMGTLPPNLEQQTSFRNAVVHRGTFPSKRDVFNYAEEVRRFIAPLDRQLEERAPDGVGALRRAQSEGIGKAGAYSAGILTILGRTTDMWPDVAALEDELKLLDSRRRGDGIPSLRGGVKTSLP